MSITANYGGWFKDQSASTGSSFSNNKVAYLVAATLLAVGTGGSISPQNLHGSRVDSHQSMDLKIPAGELSQARNPAEDLNRIREVFSPAMSDLAKALSVSRQTLYNWAREEQQPTPEHIAKLKEFSEAADDVAEAGIIVTTSLLKRKLLNGKNLFEVAHTGGSIREVTQLLVQVVQNETAQQERMAARFASRKKGPRSADSDFPALNDVS